MGLEGPEELEQLAFKRLNEGKIKDGLKLVLRAAKGYEGEGRKEDAARLYRYLGYVLLKKTNSVEKARPSLLKSAYLYIDLIEEEISRAEVDLNTLDEYCLNVLEIFMTLEDEKNLMKYAGEFAAIYEDLGTAYQDNDDIFDAINAYESAYWYYRVIGNEEAYKQLAGMLITLYGQLAEEYLGDGKIEDAANAFYNLAKFTWAIFGYDIHFIEMMDTAAKNFERASKIAYSEGDLDRTTTNLVKAQYAYLLAKNFNRSKLIAINAARMLNQLVSHYRSEGKEQSLMNKLIELSESLIGIGKFEEAFNIYKNLLEIKSSVEFRVRVRLAVIKHFAATEGHPDIFAGITELEYQMYKGRFPKALELSERIMLQEDQLSKLLSMIHRAEGLY
ncbi:hypothetical protein E3E51_00355 [Thermococcus sp. 21S7]|nr:hypothetical protein [Thermococcus sp. 21S7]